MSKRKTALNDELQEAAAAAEDKRRKFTEHCRSTRKSGVAPGLTITRSASSVDADPAAGAAEEEGVAAEELEARENEAPGQVLSYGLGRVDMDGACTRYSLD